MTNRRTLIFIHGRSWKPPAEQLKALVHEAIFAGIKRDCNEEKQKQFEQLDFELAYFADLSAELLTQTGRSFDASLDLADRANCLAELSALTKPKQFRRPSYEILPGRSSLKEFVADIGAPLMSTLRLTDVVLSKSMPEVVAYWDRKSDHYSQVTERIRQILVAPLKRGDDIFLVAHCLGSVVAYDVLWKLSQEAEREGIVGKKIHTLLTIGSPLGDEFVKRKLADRAAPDEKRFPDNLINWLNVAAEDDYTCHDESIANDFAAMLERRRISRIKDYRIYNLAIRYGRSNPHNAIGYLIHPRITKLISAWL